jgi:hypothetical protein
MKLNLERSMEEGRSKWKYLREEGNDPLPLLKIGEGGSEAITGEKKGLMSPDKPFPP